MVSTCPLPTSLVESTITSIETKNLATTNLRNLAALESVKFDASSTVESAVLKGPELAVESGKRYDFWEAAAPPPGWWSVDLESPRAVNRFTHRVFDGIIDPSSFQLQGLESEDDEDSWMTVFEAQDEKGIRGETKTYTFENARCFCKYRIVVEKTMGGPESETHPFLQGVGLFEEETV